MSWKLFLQIALLIIIAVIMVSVAKMTLRSCGVKGGMHQGMRQMQGDLHKMQGK